MAGFGDLLQQAEQLTADMDNGTNLPRIERNLHQLAEAGQRLWSRTASTAPADSANVKASILLGTRGFDVPRLSQDLDRLNTASTFEPLEPVRDTDIQGFLKNERENAILAAIEEARKNTFNQAEKHHWECLENEWEKEKQRILNNLLGAGQEPIEFPAEIESMSMSSMSMTGRSSLNSTEIAYARQVYIHNEAVVQGMRPSLMRNFLQIASKLDDQGIKDCWNILSEMTDQNFHSTHSPESIRFDPKAQQFLVNQARSFLESSYLQYIEKTVYDNPQEAQLGGVPDRINLVKSFLRIKLPAHTLDLEDGDLGGIPIWPIVFYCLRCGELNSALQAVYKAQQNIGDFKEYVKEYVDSGERRLSPSTQAKLTLHYRRSVKASPDPFKRAVYCLIGCCDTEDNHPEVITKTEDYLWLKLNQVSFDAQDDGDNDQDRTTLQQLQKKLLEEYGESHFNAFHKPILFFKVLLLTAQFEAAIEFLYRVERYRSHAVHFALALHNQRLILLPDSVQAQLLSRDPRDPEPARRLNIARLVMFYTRKFEMTDPREALQYFYLLKGMKGPQGEDIFTSCISELVLETREFDMLLGKVEEDGSRKTGCIDKFHGNTQAIVEVVAKDTENKGLFEEAVKLYDLAKNNEKALEVLNKLLSQVVSQANSPQSSRERLTNMALVMANRYKSQGHNATKSRCSTFFLLLDLTHFFDLYHNQHYDTALDVMQKLKLIPLGGESVEQKVTAFRQYTDEVRRNLPDVLLASMNILYIKYKQGSAGSMSPLGISRADDGGQEKSRLNLRKQARALITFAGLIPYRMPGNTNARLVQMEVLMN